MCPRDAGVELEVYLFVMWRVFQWSCSLFLSVFWGCWCVGGRRALACVPDTCECRKKIVWSVILDEMLKEIARKAKELFVQIVQAPGAKEGEILGTFFLFFFWFGVIWHIVVVCPRWVWGKSALRDNFHSYTDHPRTGAQRCRRRVVISSFRWNYLPITLPCSSQVTPWLSSLSFWAISSRACGGGGGGTGISGESTTFPLSSAT